MRNLLTWLLDIIYGLLKLFSDEKEDFKELVDLVTGFNLWLYANIMISGNPLLTVYSSIDFLEFANLAKRFLRIHCLL